MIDTVVIRIHNLHKYRNLYEKFVNESPRAVSRVLSDIDSAKAMENRERFSMVFHNSSRVLPLTHRNSYYSASSHYSVSYYVNPSADWVEFNFSAPKYLMSTNVLQFVYRFDLSLQKLFDRLLAVIKKVLNEFADGVPIMEDIEVNRVDFCYNQWFNSKDDALSYLDEQKKLLVKKARSSRNNFRSYDTSLMFQTRRYSFKIYHKGTEFKKHDLKQLMKRNPLCLDLPKLEYESELVLRYEMTMRNSYMNYIFSEMILKSGARVESNRENRVYKCLRLLLASGHQKIVEKYIEKSKRFFVSSGFDYSANPFIDDMELDYAPFDFSLFANLDLEFWKRVHGFQIAPVPTVQAIQNKVLEFNKRMANFQQLVKGNERKGEKRGSSLVLFAMLSQLVELELLKNILPPQTRRDLQKKAEVLGVPLGNGQINMPMPRLDYFEYFNALGHMHNDYI